MAPNSKAGSEININYEVYWPGSVYNLVALGDIADPTTGPTSLCHLIYVNFFRKAINVFLLG